jgi:hypothetical protein
MVTANRALKEMFRPKTEEVAGECRKLHNEELHNFHSTTYFTMAKSMTRWTWNVAHMESIKNPYKVLVRRYEGQRQLEGIWVDGRIILK